MEEKIKDTMQQLKMASDDLFILKAMTFLIEISRDENHFLILIQVNPLF
jgi:hypothetical protein